MESSINKEDRHANVTERTGPSRRRPLRKCLREKSSVILSEGERETGLAEGFRRAGVEGPGWPGHGGATSHKPSSRPSGGPAWLGVSQLRFGHSR